MQELMEDDEEELFAALEEIGFRLPSKVRRKSRLRIRLTNALRLILAAPLRAAFYVWGKVAWFLWGKRRFLRRLESEKKRMMELAGVEPGMKMPDQGIETSPAYAGLDQPWRSRDLPAFGRPTVPEPPVVTDKVAVDYKVVVGKPYIVGNERTLPVPAKPKRKRTPSKKKSGSSKGRSRGRSHR